MADLIVHLKISLLDYPNSCTNSPIVRKRVSICRFDCQTEQKTGKVNDPSNPKRTSPSMTCLSIDSGDPRPHQLMTQNRL
ncbi:hypothetical protein MTP99_006557 [Tenebrio molitor]|nr:hypothetical protein MTP99_006557 [Tenebrio molitor]